jgi:hypothetical protein
MARIIPNNNTFIGFFPVTAFNGGSDFASYNATTWNSSQAAPSITGVEAKKFLDITPFVISATAQSTGNTVPTPTLDSLFEGNIPGTVNASFTMDMYRDDASYTDTVATITGAFGDIAAVESGSVDFAWALFKRGVKGYMLISRFNEPVIGQGSNQRPSGSGSAATNNIVEIYPVVITAKTAGPITSNTVQTFTITAAVPFEPAEYVQVTSSSATGSVVPSVPLNLVGSQGGTATYSTTLSFAITGNSLALDWDAPVAPGGTITSYSLYSATNAALTTGIVGPITSNVTFAGTSASLVTAALTTSGVGTKYFYVVATNATGTSNKSNAVAVTLS